MRLKGRESVYRSLSIRRTSTISPRNVFKKHFHSHRGFSPVRKRSLKPKRTVSTVSSAPPEFVALRKPLKRFYLSEPRLTHRAEATVRMRLKSKTPFTVHRRFVAHQLSHRETSSASAERWDCFLPLLAVAASPVALHPLLSMARFQLQNL